MPGLLGVVGDASGKRSEEVGGVCHGGGNCGCQLKAWKDVLLVEVGAPHRKFSVVQGNGEMTLFHLSLVDSDALKGEQLDVSIDDPLIETLVPAVLADVLLSSRPACEYEGKGGEGQVLCKDCIAKKGGGEKGAEAFKIRQAMVCHGGSGEAAKSSTVRQLVMSPAGGTITWMEQRAAWWFTMTGKT